MTQANPVCAGVGVLLVCFACGCTSSKSVTVGLYARGDQPVIRHAPESAVYKVQWLSADQRELCTCVESDRLILRGESLGFATAPDGQVTAIAGTEQFTLRHLPSHARYCQWQCKTVRQTHFGRNMNAAISSVGSGALVVGAVAAEVGAGAVLEKLDDSTNGVDRTNHRFRSDDPDHVHPSGPASHRSD